MYYPPAWGFFGLLAAILSVCIAAPAASAIVYDLEGRDVYLGISITIATIVYAILFYTLCARYLNKLEESYSHGGMMSLKPVINAPTKEVRRLQKATFMMLNDMEGVRMEMLQLNNRLKELKEAEETRQQEEEQKRIDQEDAEMVDAVVRKQ